MRHWMECVTWEVMVRGQRLGRPRLGRLERGPDSVLLTLTPETPMRGGRHVGPVWLPSSTVSLALLFPLQKPTCLQG